MLCYSLQFCDVSFVMFSVLFFVAAFWLGLFWGVVPVMCFGPACFAMLCLVVCDDLLVLFVCDASGDVFGCVFRC